MKILQLPNGKFRADVVVGGKRERRNFASRPLAEAWLKQQQVLAYERKLGIAQLTPRQRLVALEAFRILPTDTDLLQIINAHLTKVGAGCPLVSLDLAIDRFLGSLKTGNRRQSYIASIGKTIRRFSKHWDRGDGVSSFGKEEIEVFLKTIKQTPVSRFNAIRDLHVFFEWCLTEHYIPENPVADIRRPLVHRKEPVILTVDQCRAVLENTSGADRAFAALGMFCGIRPAEIRQITWDMVGETSIRLPAEITKTNTSRTIQFEPCAAAWLLPLKNEAPRMAVDAFSQTKRLCLAAELSAWPQGVLRHTFASYHVTAFENPGRTALFMHSRQAPDILFRHYFRDALKSEAIKFWQIFPKNEQ